MKILFNGGLGDFIVVESFLTDSEKNEVSEIALASRSLTPIKELIENYPIFPNLQKITVFFDNWEKVFSFVDIPHIENLNKELGLNIDLTFIKTFIDYNIINIFPQINSGSRQLQNSRLFVQKSISIQLPDLFGIINPYSPSDRQNGKRDFTTTEWNNVISNIEKLGHKFYVINTSDDFVPNHLLLVDLSKKTSIIESLEIAKKASYYIGIDSWIPAILSKIMPPENLVIKTTSSHYMQYLNIYLNPIKNYGNVHGGLEYFKL